MGPSGAGKTTLMNTLAGRATYGKAFGTLLINGEPGSTVKQYSDLVGFVPQDDIMHTDLTVKENLTVYAKLRLPARLRWRHTSAPVTTTRTAAMTTTSSTAARGTSSPTAG